MEIINYRDFKGLTQAEFADKLGITVTRLNQYTYGTTTPRKRMMMKICLVTEGLVNANDFYGTTSDVIDKKLLEISRLSKLTKVGK